MAILLPLTYDLVFCYQCRNVFSWNGDKLTVPEFVAIYRVRQTSTGDASWPSRVNEKASWYFPTASSKDRDPDLGSLVAKSTPAAWGFFDLDVSFNHRGYTGLNPSSLYAGCLAKVQSLYRQRMQDET